MNKEIKEYVKAERKGRLLWEMAKKEENSKRKAKLQNKAKDSYARRDAIGLSIQSPKNNVRNTSLNLNVNNSLNKNKSVNVKTRLSLKK